MGERAERDRHPKAPPLVDNLTQAMVAFATSEHPLRIVLVDDAADLRALVRHRLETAGGFDVVGEGRTGHDAIRLTARHRPDLFVRHLERFRAAVEGATIGVAALTLSGRIVRANATLAQIMRSNESELFGQLFADVVDQASRKSVADAVVYTSDSPRPVSFEHRLRAERGEAR